MARRAEAAAPAARYPRQHDMIARHHITHAGAAGFDDAARRTEAIQLGSGPAGQLIGYGAADGGRQCEAVPREAQRQRQSRAIWHGSDKRNAVEAERFEAAPGALDAPRRHGRIQLAGGGPIAALAALAQRVAAASVSPVVEPAAAQQVRSV